MHSNTPPPHPEAVAQIDGSDWVFGCVDNDGARLQLLELCSSRALPYVDLATEVFPEMAPPAFGGRVCVMIQPDDGCLMCRGLLSQEDIRRSLSDEAGLRDQEAIYGVRAAALSTSGPAVAALNALIAAAGVMEFMVTVTGLRDPNLHLEYQGTFGVLARSTDAPEPGCFYCERRRRALAS